MKYYIGVGSNLGDRQKNINDAIEKISQFSKSIVRAYNYENPAWVPAEVQEDWNYPFLNTAVMIETAESPEQLLCKLKDIENEMGRKESARWAPRVIDLDILCGDQHVNTENLKIPHPGLVDRPFVLAPLRDLSPLLEFEGKKILDWNRQVTKPIPLWMGIVNVTQDSFSDGGLIKNEADFFKQLTDYSENNIQILDLGAESTRPGAIELNPEDEWKRLKPFLSAHADFKKNNNAPALSIDTRHPYVAERAIEFGVDYINDVSGVSKPEMFSLLKHSNTKFIFMHSLTVPADPKKCLSFGEPAVDQVERWLDEKVEEFGKNNISLDRVIFDPGIGFGKAPHQSLELLKKIRDFKKYPVQILVGHSRKSFMKNFSSEQASERDFESIGMSLSLAESGVDIIRVHKPVLHSQSFRGWSHIQ